MAQGADARSMERDILLAQNEFAYVQDMTKGIISLNVGPTKISLSNTERVVTHDADKRRFVPLENRTSQEGDTGGIQQFVEATSSQYLILTNPRAPEAKDYIRGSNDPVELLTGKRIVVPGPASFPLWPGQTATVIDGHEMKDDEYLLVRAYDTPSTPQKPAKSGEKGSQDNDPEKKEEGNGGESEDSSQKTPTSVMIREGEEIQIGTEQIVRGTDTRFFIPPNGFEVVKAPNNEYVRKAVKLMDGKYCILLRPDGEKKYVDGPAMVIPEPEEALFHGRATDGRGETIFDAYKMRQERGLHLSVTRDFTVEKDDPLAKIIGEGRFKIGQELFVHGKEGLFFPDENLGVVKEVKPVALAEDEGVYVRNNQTGEITTVKGQKNFLPDPTKEEIVDRHIDPKLDEVLAKMTAKRDPRRAVSVYVPPNHAMMVTSEKGRNVVEGPQTHILDYSEDLETLALSTETPKTDKKLLRTALLQVEGNKVSDKVRVETQDHVNLDVRVSYRISFEEEPEKWFDVNNYVGLLCDHLSSIVRSAVQRHPLETFYSGSTEIVRDAVLGKKKEGEDRSGRPFKENGMRVYDLEVLSVDVLDEGVNEMLADAQQNTFKMEMDKREAERKFDLTKATEGIAQQTNSLKTKSLESEQGLLEKQEEVRTSKAELDAKIDRITQVGAAQARVEARKAEYAHEKERAGEEQARKLELLEKETSAWAERMKAITPELTTAMTRLGDQNLIIESAKHLGEASLFENKSVHDMMQMLWKGMPFGRGGLAFLDPSRKGSGPEE